MKYKRICLIVLDSLGIGEAKDAALYGDEGSNTLGHIAERMISEKGSFAVPNLQKLGFFNIDGTETVAGGRYRLPDSEISGVFARLCEASKGKDTTTGHWEIAGLKTEVPFRTFPNGFPEAFIKEYERAIGCEVLGNCTASGTEIIERLGPEHEATGKPIVYTSADSVFQIAANTAVIPLEGLYEMCVTARKMLVGELAVGRVIARPYVKREDGTRERTSDRKDFSVSPTGPTALDYIKGAGKTVYAVGKISDIFNGCGISEAVHTVDNADGVDKTVEALEKDFCGLIFTNLVDFDSKFGHRRNPIGYGEAIEAFDARLPEIFEAMRADDLLILCADHGNDPVHAGTDHTREDIPMLAYAKGIKAKNLGTRRSFSDIGKTVCELLRVDAPIEGESFAEEL